MVSLLVVLVDVSWAFVLVLLRFFLDRFLLVLLLILVDLLVFSGSRKDTFFPPLEFFDDDVGLLLARTFLTTFGVSFEILFEMKSFIFLHSMDCSPAIASATSFVVLYVLAIWALLSAWYLAWNSVSMSL